jgi:hypothetical protein
MQIMWIEVFNMQIGNGGGKLQFYCSLGVERMNENHKIAWNGNVSWAISYCLCFEWAYTSLWWACNVWIGTYLLVSQQVYVPLNLI